MLHAIVLKRFETAVAFLSRLDHRGCVNELSESLRALQEGTDLIPPRFQFFSGATALQRRELQWIGDIPSRLKDLDKDIRLHQNVAKAGMMIKQGDNQISDACEKPGEFKMELVFMAMDSFKQAIIDAGSGLGGDVEWLHEAWANSRLGHVYSKIRKEPAIGIKYYKQCLFVAFAIERRTTCEAESWFREANVEAQAYQQQNILRDQQAVSIRREPFLRQLKSDLVSLKKANKNADALLDFLHKAYGSPKSPPHDASSNKKKHLFDVMKKFDPMKCADETGQFGPHIFTAQKVLYEEITKMLTHHYETNFKGGVE